MGKGGYNGGSTIVNSWSDWFSKGKPKKKALRSNGLVTLNAAEKEAQLKYEIEVAAERLAQAQAEFEAGNLRPIKTPKAKPLPTKSRKKKKPMKKP